MNKQNKLIYLKRKNFSRLLINSRHPMPKEVFFFKYSFVIISYVAVQDCALITINIQ